MFDVFRYYRDKDDDIIVLQDTENVFNTLLQFKNYTKNTPYSDVLFELDIKKLFVQILLCYEKVGTGNTYNLYVNKALRYIKQNFNRDISTDDVAAYLGISAVYFQKIFHSATDEKFNRYLNKQRINYAVNLLQNTNYSLKKIAAMVGYNSLQNFIGNFKRIMQTSPSEYKNGVFDGFKTSNDSYINEIYRETVFKSQ